MPTSKHRKNHKQKLNAYRARVNQAQNRIKNLLKQDAEKQSTSVWSPDSQNNVLKISGSDQFLDLD